MRTRAPLRDASQLRVYHAATYFGKPLAAPMPLMEVP
jgi:hypothetical protein